jgi:glycosyltransferase involved in cell wall biosynthesis
MNHDMIVFGEDWGRHPSSTQHLMQRLAGDAKIIWVNSLGLRRPRFNKADWARLKSKAVSILQKPKINSDGSICRHPFACLANPKTLPFPSSTLASIFNRLSLSNQIGKLIKQSNISRPILWTSLPTALCAVGALGERALVYYAGDDFGALAGVDHGPVLAMERSLASKADLIIAASPLIAERFPAHKTRVLPHGVDYELFATPVARADDLPSDRPVAGFYGSLNDWIDVQSLADAARRLPSWDIVIIGNVESNISALQGLPNVKLLGPRSHRELPSYSQHWDVSLLPFKKNRQIDASNPLKLREYLACGTPVLASYRFPAAAAYEKAINFIEDGEGLAEAILRAKNGSKSASFRQYLVRHESWDSRADTLRSWLSEL